MGSSSKDDSGSDAEASSGDKTPSNSSLFSEGERVLAYHGPRIYEAKASLSIRSFLFYFFLFVPYDFVTDVQKAELRKKEWRYFVHYLYYLVMMLSDVPFAVLQGWNKNWDEWVGMDRLMKHTPDNVLKQQTLEKKQGVDKGLKPGRSSQTKPKNSTDSKMDKEDPKSNDREICSYELSLLLAVAKGKKRKSDSGMEKDNLPVEKLVKIQIPSTLKKQLVDDWEFVTQQDKLVKLPRSPNVDDILTKYLEYMSKKDGMITDSIGEILKGIRCYFDKALPVMLLYKKERQQYHDTVKTDVSPSTIYGAEHLLRLFVKLPELLAYVNIEEDTSTRLQQKLLDFLKYSLHPYFYIRTKVLSFFQLMMDLKFLKAKSKGKISELLLYVPSPCPLLLPSSIWWPTDMTKLVGSTKRHTLRLSAIRLGDKGGGMLVAMLYPFQDK
ncbi:hypothetical protein POTOM_027028 [Populus tomentosa]|uniref:MRG domain-containing protein n=1 Tax=Populus tomentosa TaxID=118781 RepID=A0A8X7ZFK5_POPTO|nr:hypothetical protein POTOM_027028 [Populus tomentosa]